MGGTTEKSKMSAYSTLAKVGVEGSNPFARSNTSNTQRAVLRVAVTYGNHEAGFASRRC